jgi:hypothetical protein
MAIGGFATSNLTADARAAKRPQGDLLGPFLLGNKQSRYALIWARFSSYRASIPLDAEARLAP